jgi:hypothetical protein
MAYRTYSAVAKTEAESPYRIDVRFLGGLTPTQEAAFEAAADRWTTVIVGDLPDVTLEGDEIDDVLILAQGSDIDGVGQILGQAGPTHVRAASAGPFALLPVKGIMTFDTADLGAMEEEGTLHDVITHEMGHVLGIGTLWRHKGLVEGLETDNPRFVGALASAEYAALRGCQDSGGVPVENTGGPGTRGGHWRETVFRNELMSGFISEPGNPLSRVTAGSLADMGYEVDIERADPYELVDLVERADRGELLPRSAPIDRGIVLPVIPQVLPD